MDSAINSKERQANTDGKELEIKCMTLKRKWKVKINNSSKNFRFFFFFGLKDIKVLIR